MILINRNMILTNILRKPPLHEIIIHTFISIIPNNFIESHPTIRSDSQKERVWKCRYLLKFQDKFKWILVVFYYKTKVLVESIIYILTNIEFFSFCIDTRWWHVFFLPRSLYYIEVLNIINAWIWDLNNIAESPPFFPCLIRFLRDSTFGNKTVISSYIVLHIMFFYLDFCCNFYHIFFSKI